MGIGLAIVSFLLGVALLVGAVNFGGGATDAHLGVLAHAGSAVAFVLTIALNPREPRKE